jgi:hypothetical protein
LLKELIIKRALGIDMYWVDEPNNASISDLSNSQILENLFYVKKRFEYLYRRELCKLEKMKSNAIIRNIEEFKSAQKKYFQMKSMLPEAWLESWEVYKEILHEASKRNLVSKIRNS